MTEVDERFWDRADAHIHLSNEQLEELGDMKHAGKVSASHMYSTARFAAWLSFRGCVTADEFRNFKAENIKYFLDEFEKMLTENFDDYEANFENYLEP